MLYRFREAQEPELGLGTRGDTAAHQELERWRAERWREISRKVARIQDDASFSL
ncbi:hypothetical protein K438DRAFT_1847974 [Mycena galopus ATCC 62051]|nr:hypothetical protein K438DRAFT_1847974 [Mycena galopus ATCC 62051]